LIAINILQDPLINLQERKVYTVTDALSQTGGLAGVINIIFHTIAGVV
jgi:hypothetical protein